MKKPRDDISPIEAYIDAIAEGKIPDSKREESLFLIGSVAGSMYAKMLSTDPSPKATAIRRDISTSDEHARLAATNLVFSEPTFAQPFALMALSTVEWSHVRKILRDANFGPI